MLAFSVLFSFNYLVDIMRKLKHVFISFMGSMATYTFVGISQEKGTLKFHKLMRSATE